MNADGSDPHHLAGGVRDKVGLPTISPDGRTVAFLRDTGHEPGLVWRYLKLWLVGIEGSSERSLTGDTTSPTYESEAAWSPDGKRIAFTHGRGNGRPFELDVIAPDGSGRRTLARNAWGGFFSTTWSPDGNRIAFSSYVKSDLYVVGADGTGLRRLTRTPKIDEIQPIWQP